MTQLEEVPAIQDLECCSAVGEHGAWKGCRDHIPEGTAGGDVRVWASGPATGKVPGLGGTLALERRFLPPPNRQSESGPLLWGWMAVRPLSERAPAIDDEGSGVGEAGPFPRRQSALAQPRSRRPVAETGSSLSDTGPAAPASPSPPVSVQSRR